MIRIRKYQKKDLIECARISKETFYEFASEEEKNSKPAQEYMDAYDTKKDIDAVRKMMEMSKMFFVAEVNNKIIGLVRGGFEFANGKIIKDIGRVRGLYVNGRYHKKGIGRMLMKRFEKEAIEKGFRQIKIRASFYAIPFYQKVGYKKSTGVRNMGGLDVYPMRKYL